MRCVADINLYICREQMANSRREIACSHEIGEGTLGHFLKWRFDRFRICAIDDLYNIHPWNAF